MNVIKTKYMGVGVKSGDSTLDNSITVEKVDQYKYLGVTFTSEGKDTIKIQNRITQSRKLIGALNGILFVKNQEEKQDQNIQFYDKKCANLWQRSMDEKKKILVTEMDAIRRSAGIKTRA